MSYPPKPPPLKLHGPTIKQVNARKRNWIVHQLRGIHANSKSIEFAKPKLKDNMRNIRRLIEDSLTALDAETHKEQQERLSSKIMGSNPKFFIIDEPV